MERVFFLRISSKLICFRPFTDTCSNLPQYTVLIISKGGILINNITNRDWMIAAVSLLAFFLLWFLVNLNNGDQTEKDDNGSSEETDTEEEILWGVDSAQPADELYQCITENFGDPMIYGRYLGEIEDVSVALTEEEIEFLHEQDSKILVIYNHLTEPVGYDTGEKHAKKAIEMAEELGVPEGVAIFGDIEPDFPVDSAFIEGWYETLEDSQYEPALYGVFDEESELMIAYNDTEEEVQENTIVWTAYPQEDVTTEDDAPEYDPQGPENAKVYGWQYAIDAETCVIDTNLFQNEMLDYVW